MLSDEKLFSPENHIIKMINGKSSLLAHTFTCRSNNKKHITHTRRYHLTIHRRFFSFFHFVVYFILQLYPANRHTDFCIKKILFVIGSAEFGIRFTTDPGKKKRIRTVCMRFFFMYVCAQS